HYQPAEQVSCDLHTIVSLPDGRLALAVAGVSGKGVPAARCAAQFAASLQECLCAEPDVALAVTVLNRRIIPFRLEDRFVTLLVAVLDPVHHLLTLVNAGHLPLLLRRQGATAIEEHPHRDLAGLPLGIVEEATYESGAINLLPGDCAILQTDGFLDALG